MVRQLPDFFIIKKVHASSFWNDIADKLMVPLEPAFLVGKVGITVKDSGAQFPVRGVLNRPGVLKFGAIVRKDYWKSLFEETVSKQIVEHIKTVNDAFLVATVKQEYQHKAGSSEQ